MTVLWTKEELDADCSKERAFKPCLDEALSSKTEKLTVTFKKEGSYGGQNVTFGRKVGDTEWQCLQSDSNFHHLAAHRDTTYGICQDLSCPVRTAKIGVYSTVTCCDECWMCSVFSETWCSSNATSASRAFRRSIRTSRRLSNRKRRLRAQSTLPSGIRCRPTGMQ